jgi:hypothetical protein
VKRITATCCVVLGLLGPTAVGAHTTGVHDNCTRLNQKWPHGVGRRGAVDQGGNVTNFTRNTRAYNRADAHNGTLDRDNDKIACEKA